jgi:hypothetical protein
VDLVWAQGTVLATDAVCRRANDSMRKLSASLMLTCVHSSFLADKDAETVDKMSGGGGEMGTNIASVWNVHM